MAMLFSSTELESISESQIQSVGHKAWNLSRLIHFGFNVPRGFVISVDLNKMKTAQAEEVRKELLEAIEQHRNSGYLFDTWAVRSSGVDEDSSELSFAGQFDSFLNISNGESLADSIIKCFHSRENARSIQYRESLNRGGGLTIKDGFDPISGFGVILQEMVRASVSGICFTRNPFNSATLVIEFVPGLGEGLVSGKVKPAHFEFKRESLELVFVDDSQGWLSLLGEENLKEVAQESLKAEEKFGYEVDLEWAFEGSNLFFLQARPLTHLQVQRSLGLLIEAEKEMLKGLSHNSGNVWTDFSISDVLQHPSPLTVDGYRDVGLPGAGVDRAYRSLGLGYRVRSESSPPIYDSVCGRSYVNVTEYIQRIASGLPLKAVIQGKEIEVKIDPQGGLGKILAIPVTLLWRAASVFKNFYPMRKKFHREFIHEIKPRLEEEAAQEREKNLSQLSDENLWDLYCRYKDKNKYELNYYHMMTDIIAGWTQGAIKLGLKLVYGKSKEGVDQAQTLELNLKTGLDGNFNTETNLALCDVVDGKRTLSEFLRDYGHRGSPDWEVSAPRWREDPTPLYEMMENLEKSRVRGRNEFENQRVVRLESENRFKQDIRRRWITRIFESFFLRELRYFQIYSPLREATHSLCFLWVELARRVLIEMARRRDVGDLIFYLKIAELKSFFLCKETAERERLLNLARQRKKNLSLLRTVYVPHLFSEKEINSLGKPPSIDPQVKSLQGQVIFRGYVTGIARVVRNLSEAKHLRKGEILVTQFADPAWTPLFFTAGGLVLEQGSSFSHGALIAREIGLPGIVNVPEATRYIQTGQEITLDAYQGRVLLPGIPGKEGSGGSKKEGCSRSKEVLTV